MMIYIVMGSTGEYSDRSEWPSRAFHTKHEAEKYVLLLQETYRQFPGEYGYSRDDDQMDKMVSTMQLLDSGFQEDYTGTHWFTEEVECDGCTRRS